MKLCPNPICGLSIPGWRFSCPRCFNSIPEYLKHKLTGAYAQLKRDLIGPGQLAELEDKIKVAMKWKDEPAQVGFNRRGCVKCGRQVFICRTPPDGSGCQDTIELTLGDWPPTGAVFIVYAFQAVQVDGSKNLGAYARFREHDCDNKYGSPVSYVTPADLSGPKCHDGSFWAKIEYQPQTAGNFMVGLQEE